MRSGVAAATAAAAATASSTLLKTLATSGDVSAEGVARLAWHSLVAGLASLSCTGVASADDDGEEDASLAGEEGSASRSLCRFRRFRQRRERLLKCPSGWWVVGVQGALAGPSGEAAVVLFSASVGADFCSSVAKPSLQEE